MMLLLLNFQVSEENIIKRKFLKDKKVINTYDISLKYNIDEDRFYYEDKNKSIPTKKDLSRSILIFYDIFKRYEKFHLKDNFKLTDNNLENFLDLFTTSNNHEDSIYYQKMLFGTQSVNLNGLNFICQQLGIKNIDFYDYFYTNYNQVDFI